MGHSIGTKREISRAGRDITNQFAKRALVGFGFMFAAIGVPIFSKGIGLRGYEWEAARTASMALLGLGWYSIWWPGRSARVGVRFLIVLWTAAVAMWVAVVVNSGKDRQVIMQSFALASTILAAELTLRQVVTPESNRSNGAE